MEKPDKRRKFLKMLMALPAFTSVGELACLPVNSPDNAIKSGRHQLKISLNTYSFNEPLSKGTMTLDDLLEFFSQHRFDAVDLTGYYAGKISYQLWS